MAPQGKLNHGRLILVLGDQLDPHSAAFDDFDSSQDIVWMAEVAEESKHVWSHQARTAIFLSAMRHLRDALRARAIRVEYTELDEAGNTGTFSGEMERAIKKLKPESLVVIEPGEWRVQQALLKTAKSLGIKLEIRPDRHFICSRDEFADHLRRHPHPRMEYFYREMRVKTGALMQCGKPVGDEWNFDKDNRKSFDRDGPGLVPRPLEFPPDKITREVISVVRKKFTDHPGNLDKFNWPVTPGEARKALHDFIHNRLPLFGDYEDAMWSGETTLYHSRLSMLMNLKLLNPREVIAAAEEALNNKRAPLAGVEGFIRQIIGWREYVRGVYWHFMPEYLERNHLHAEEPLPWFYWTGKTEMNCLKHALSQTLELGYAHHIQRLMVTGLFSLLLGVRPQEVHKWYLAIYVDAVEWVELPNTLGMSQYGDGGVMGSKPYVASGKYIQRMSNYCEGCRFNPAERTGLKACPFTTLYWDFLLRHEPMLEQNQRMRMQLKNLARLSADERSAIQDQAQALRKEYAATSK